MKKVVVYGLIILCITGCSAKIGDNGIIYRGYVEELTELEKTTTKVDVVDIEIELDRSSHDEIAYSVVIDNPKIKMKNVEAIVYHDQETVDVFPSIGIFDDKVNLIPGLKANENKNVKGIVLVGYIQTTVKIEKFHPTLKVMILYNNSENEREKIYYSKKL